MHVLRKAKEYLKVIEDSPEKATQLKALLCSVLSAIREAAPDEYFDTLYRLHCIAYGAHFDEFTAKMATGEMRNTETGAVGEHWTLEQCSGVAASNKIKNKYDMYYVMNMLYSDFSGVLGDDSSTYSKMAKAYICDVDAPESKVFDTWFAMVKAKEASK